jgi:hypothetical protein
VQPVWEKTRRVFDWVRVRSVVGGAVLFAMLARHYPPPPNPVPLRLRIALPDNPFPESVAKTTLIRHIFPENARYAGLTPIGAFSVAL